MKPSPRRTLLSALLAALMASSHADDGLHRCRTLAEPTSRLACYDALADAPQPRPTAGSATTPAPSAETTFGLPESRRPDGIDMVRTAVGPRFAGWGPNSRIRLDNGQVWQVMDGSSVVLSEGVRAVTVRRGALGSFYLDIEGLKTSPRVQRAE